MSYFREIADLFGVKLRHLSIEMIVLDAIKETSRKDVKKILRKNPELLEALRLDILEMDASLKVFIDVSYDSWPEPEEVMDFWDGIFIYAELAQLIDIFQADTIFSLTVLFDDKKMRKLFKICYRDSLDIQNKFVTGYVRSALNIKAKKPSTRSANKSKKKKTKKHRTNTAGFLHRLLNFSGKNIEALKDELRDLVQREKRFDLLEETIHSDNPDVKIIAQSALNSCAHLEEAKTIRDAVMPLAKGDFSDKYMFVYYCFSTQLVDDEILERMVEFFDFENFYLRSTAAEYAYRIDGKGLDQLGAKVYDSPSYKVANHTEFDNWGPARNRVHRTFRLALLARAGCDRVEIERHAEVEDGFATKSLYTWSQIDPRDEDESDLTRELIGLYDTQTMMKYRVLTQMDIIGMSMHCDDPDDILNMIDQYSNLKIQNYIVGCGWAMSHLARRFKRTDIEIWRRIFANSQLFAEDEFVRSVIETIRDDISGYMEMT